MKKVWNFYKKRGNLKFLCKTQISIRKKLTFCTKLEPRRRKNFSTSGETGKYIWKSCRNEKSMKKFLTSLNFFEKND